MKEKTLFEQTLTLRSDYLETISKMFEMDFGKPVTISNFHVLKHGNGNTVFYVVTQDNYKFLVDLIGYKENQLIYWIENIDFSGKLAELFYAEDDVVITFSRGDKYNNEYLAYFYTFGNRYPAVRFISNDLYLKYSEMLAARYIKHKIKGLPEEFFVGEKSI